MWGPPLRGCDKVLGVIKCLAAIAENVSSGVLQVLQRSIVSDIDKYRNL